MSISERTSQAPDTAEDDAKTVPGQSVPDLIRQALGASGVKQAQLAGRVNARLRGLARSSEPRAAADVLVRALEAASLGHLTDPDGNCCRAVAVEALLALGYPFALEVSPEDLDFLRSQGPAVADASADGRPWLRAVVYPAAAAEVLLAATGFDSANFSPWVGAGDSAAFWLGIGHGCATAGIALGAEYTASARARRFLVALLTVCAGLGLALAGGGITPALFVGLTAFAACLSWQKSQSSSVSPLD